jgi:gliding motility-associated-like protein
VQQVTLNVTACEGDIVYGTRVVDDTTLQFNDVTYDGCDSITTVRVTLIEQLLYDTVRYCATQDAEMHTVQVDTTVGSGCEAVLFRTFIPVMLPTPFADVHEACEYSYIHAGDTSLTLTESAWVTLTFRNALNCTVDTTFWVEVHQDTLEDKEYIVPILAGQQLYDVYTGVIIDWYQEDGRVFDSLTRVELDTRLVGSVVDSFGCKREIELFLDIEPADLNIPTAFSPNGDGINDVFQVFGNDILRVNSIKIFNRWGDLMYDEMRADYRSGEPLWDGTFQGKLLNPGVYIVLVEVTVQGGKTVQLKSDLTLIL